MCCHLNKVLKRKETAQVSTLILVGGYAACRNLKEEIEIVFPKFNIICPYSVTETIVLLGAVQMGHESRPIVGRIYRYHYGLLKPNGMRIITHQDSSMDDNLLYFPLINKRDSINIGEQVAHYRFLVESNESLKGKIKVILCDDEQPSSCFNVNCAKIGEIDFNINKSCKGTEIVVAMAYKETEFEISATNNKTGQTFSTICTLCTFLP